MKLPETLQRQIGNWPYRLALAGGWIDQPRFNSLNAEVSGSMVTVRIAPDFPFMPRCGIATSTREAAMRLWVAPPLMANMMSNTRILYGEENRTPEKQKNPSGSQDAVGLLSTGISRLDYGREAVFPDVVVNLEQPYIWKWLENVLHLLPVGPRPLGYDPFLLGTSSDPTLIAELGMAGRTCFDAIVAMDIIALGQSLRRTSLIWRTLMPGIYRHPNIKQDLWELLHGYDSICYGAMYSGCGGGYLILASNEPIPGTFKIRIV